MNGKMRGKGLGRGLGSLLGGEAETTNVSSTSSAVSNIDINLIEPNPWQPRTEFDNEKLEELAESIKSMGIIQPLTLRKLSDNKYQLISGERRLRASKMAGLAEVPAYVREAGDDGMLIMALIENIQRDDLNPIEEALSYQRLIEECNITQEELASRVSKKRSTVTNSLRLLKLPPEIQNGLLQKHITKGHARAIVSIDDADTQLMLYQQIIECEYSVRQIEEMVKRIREGADEPEPEPEPVKPAPVTKTPLSDVYLVLKDQLVNRFGTPVKFERNDNGKGKITIPFSSDEELERIMDILDRAK